MHESLSYFPVNILYISIISPLTLRYFKVGNFNLSKRCLYGNPFNSWISFVAIPSSPLHLQLHPKYVNIVQGHAVIFQYTCTSGHAALWQIINNSVFSQIAQVGMVRHHTRHATLIIMILLALTRKHNVITRNSVITSTNERIWNNTIKWICMIYMNPNIRSPLFGSHVHIHSCLQLCTYQFRYII